MKNFKRILAVSSLVGILGFGLTACVGETVYTADNPATEGYTVEYVSTNDGDFKCLWHSKGYTSAAMSCEEITK